MEFPTYPMEFVEKLDGHLKRLPAGVNTDEFRAAMLAFTQVIYCRGYELGYNAGRGKV